MTVRGIEARVLTGVPPYDQHQRVKDGGLTGVVGAGPTAALMLLAYWDARFGYRQLLAHARDGAGAMPECAAVELRRAMHTLNDSFHGQPWAMTLPMFFQAGLEGYIGERFDPEGAYVRRWVPELARLPKKYLHKPWTAPAAVLDQPGIVLGRDYPSPLVDHDTARKAALAAFAALRNDTGEAVGEE